MDNEDLRKGLETAFVDRAYRSNLAVRPEFISNDYKKGRKVLSSIEYELNHCDEFCISVAFITTSGIQPLLMTLKELERKGIPGRILTTDYLTFSEPKALEKLAGLKNIELRMYKTAQADCGFHTKGYIFRESEIYRIIIGSSNMTLSAITKNREWNTKIVSTDQGQVAKDILEEYEELWEDTCTYKYEDFIEEYKKAYLRGQLIKKQKLEAAKNSVVSFDQYTLKPNKMQVDFVKNIMELRRENKEKALFCSATASGKTIASAFAVREMKAGRVLFLVHREQIAKQALNSYRRIFGDSVTYGLISGNRRDMDADFIFATMQMMTKPEIYEKFKKDEFNVAVIDEYEIIGLSQEAA